LLTVRQRDAQTNTGKHHLLGTGNKVTEQKDIRCQAALLTSKQTKRRWHDMTYMAATVLCLQTSRCHAELARKQETTTLILV